MTEVKSYDRGLRCCGKVVLVKQTNGSCGNGWATFFDAECPKCGKKASGQFPEHLLREWYPERYEDG